MHTFQPMTADMMEFDPFTKIGKEWAAAHRRFQRQSKHHDHKLGRCRHLMGQKRCLCICP